MKKNIFAFVNNRQVFLIADHYKLDLFNAVSNTPSQIVEFKDTVSTGTCICKEGSISYLGFQPVDTISNKEMCFLITRWPDEITEEDAYRLLLTK